MEKSLPKVKKIKVTNVVAGQEHEKELIVTKMPLGRGAEFLRELAKIPKTIENIAKMMFGEPVKTADFVEAAKQRAQDPEQAEKIAASFGDDISNNDLIEAVFALPSILVEHWDDLVNLLAIASEIPVEELRKLDIDEATTVIFAVIEVNNFFGIGDRYREMLGRKKAAQQAMTIPQHGKRNKTG